MLKHGAWLKPKEVFYHILAFAISIHGCIFAQPRPAGCVGNVTFPLAPGRQRCELPIEIQKFSKLLLPVFNTDVIKITPND